MPEPATQHCPTCVCDPSSEAACARTKMVAPFKIPKDSVMFCLLTQASAHARILKWWSEKRRHRARPARLEVEFIAHEEEIEILVRPPAPPAESYRRNRRHSPE